MKIKRISLMAILWLLLISFTVFAQGGWIEVLRFKDADIRLVLQAIAQKAIREGRKANIVVTPEVEGLVTLDLESIDWETALKVVLKTYGYGYVAYNDVIIVAPLEKLKEIETKEKERQAVESPQVKVFKLKYIDANDAKRTIEPMLSGVGSVSVLEVTGQAGWEFGTDPSKRVRAKEGKLSRSKVLLVSDITKKLDEITRTLEAIDVMPKQVLIKARIMEVNRDLLRDIGFDWGTGSSGAESSTMHTTPTAKKGGLDVTQMATHILAPTPSAFGPKTTNLTADNAGLKLLFKRLAGAQFEVILHALEEDLRTNTLSAPVLLTLNNQEATILVGTKFPIIKTEVSTETGQIIGGSLQEYKDIGIQLNVVPQIWGEDDEFINMIIHPAVTSYTTTSKITSSAGATLVEYPIIVSREAETQLVMKDGETIVMGGLLKDVKTKQEIGVPFLSKIPLIGKIFKRDTLDTEKIDLLIFITAKIVKAGELVPAEIVDTTKLNSEFEKK